MACCRSVRVSWAIIDACAREELERIIIERRHRIIERFCLHSSVQPSAVVDPSQTGLVSESLAACDAVRDMTMRILLSSQLPGQLQNVRITVVRVEKDLTMSKRKYDGRATG
jgi:hypothetical protein